MRKSVSDCQNCPRLADHHLRAFSMPMLGLLGPSLLGNPKSCPVIDSIAPAAASPYNIPPCLSSRKPARKGTSCLEPRVPTACSNHTLVCVPSEELASFSL